MLLRAAELHGVVPPIALLPRRSVDDGGTTEIVAVGGVGVLLEAAIVVVIVLADLVAVVGGAAVVGLVAEVVEVGLHLAQVQVVAVAGPAVDDACDLLEVVGVAVAALVEGGEAQAHE